jgi:hypothetical protein
VKEKVEEHQLSLERESSKTTEPAEVVPDNPQEHAPEKPRMKLSEAAKRAAESEDAVLLGQVVDQLRFKHGYDYEQCLDYVRKHTGIDPDKYEGMLYEADTQEAEQPRSLSEGPENLKPPGPEPAPGINEEDPSISETREPVTGKNGDERQPEVTLSCNDVRGSLWLNRSDRGGDYFTVSIARVHRGQDGSLKTTQSFRQKDLPDLIEVAKGAQKIIQEESQKRGLEQQTNAQSVKISR